ncbi:MAG: hypothetical protein ACYDAR_16105, partial [Thermomicrobiales bacterium]
MNEQCADERTEAQTGSGKALKRRGILAAAGAVVAGVVAKQTAEPVLAATLTLDADNPTGSNTNIHGPGSPPPWTADQIVVSVFSVNNTGVGTAIAAKGMGGGFGLFAQSDGSPAVVARVTGTGFGLVASTHGGLYGISGSTSSASSDSAGITGSSSNGNGVIGTSNAGIYGVYGTSGAAGGCGVRGDCTGGTGVLGSVSDGYGVLGQANTGNGVRGYSQQNHAIVGQTGRTYYGGVFGVATLTNTVGIYGSTVSNGANVTSAYAGYMDGNFVCVHGAKSAAVPHADGSYRLMYCMESPESWFEDFGKAQLVGGKAVVRLDPDFAAVVQTKDYHIFLTTYGDFHAHIAAQDTRGFTI